MTFWYWASLFFIVFLWYLDNCYMCRDLASIEWMCEQMKIWTDWCWPSSSCHVHCWLHPVVLIWDSQNVYNIQSKLWSETVEVLISVLAQIPIWFADWFAHSIFCVIFYCHMLSPKQFSWAGHWFARYHCDVLALNACHMPASHEMGIESSCQFAGTLGFKSMISGPDIICCHLFDVYFTISKVCVLWDVWYGYWTPALLTT